MEKVVCRVVARVVFISVLARVCVDVIGLYVQDEPVGVGVEHSNAITVNLLEVIVIPVVHEILGQIENTHDEVSWSIKPHFGRAHVVACDIIIGHHAVVEGRFGDEFAQLILFRGTNEFDIYASTDIFHCLPKDAVVYQLVQILFERALGLSVEPG